MSEPVSRELFDERTLNIQREMKGLREEMAEIRKSLSALPGLVATVREHDKTLATWKKWGLRLLIFLAGGGTIGALSLTDILKIMGLGN